MMKIGIHHFDRKKVIKSQETKNNDEIVSKLDHAFLNISIDNPRSALENYSFSRNFGQNGRGFEVKFPPILHNFISSYHESLDPPLMQFFGTEYEAFFPKTEFQLYTKII